LGRNFVALKTKGQPPRGVAGGVSRVRGQWCPDVRILPTSKGGQKSAGKRGNSESEGQEKGRKVFHLKQAVVATSGGYPRLITNPGRGRKVPERGGRLGGESERRKRVGERAKGTSPTSLAENSKQNGSWKFGGQEQGSSKGGGEHAWPYRTSMQVKQAKEGQSQGGTARGRAEGGEK